MATEHSEIAWCDSTWNPVRGCSRVSAGCEHCYAEKQAHRFSGSGQPYEGLTRLASHGPIWTGKIRLVPEALDQPLHWKTPRRIFTNSMSDLFHEDVPDEFICDVFTRMRAAHWHTFQTLTKRPERMRRVLSEIGQTLPNAWWGVSCEDQATADERIPLLLQTPAAVRWVSAEPLLGPIDFDCYFYSSGVDGEPAPRNEPGQPKLSWLVIGGESGPGARPCNLEWTRSILQQCKVANVRGFIKQVGSNPWWTPNLLRPEIIARCTPFRDRKGGDPLEWPADLQNCREFPT